MTDISSVIAIDGTSASGKGTIARRLASHYDFAYLDTGILYRAVGLAILKEGSNPSDKPIAIAKAKSLIPDKWVNTSDASLRSNEVSLAASQVAAIQEVRDILLSFQKNFYLKPPQNKKGAVLDGRDIGTVIAPHAKAKLFITATAEVRARRRFKELEQYGLNTSYEDVLKDMQARDKRDAERSVVPTKPAEDAVLLDTTQMDANTAFAEALAIVEKKMA